MSEYGLKVATVLNYFKKYPSIFNEREQRQIIGMINCSYKKPYEYDVIREIYDYFGWIPEDENIYNGFCEFLDYKFGLDGKNIVEVGGGHLPQLAKKISAKQKTGKITVYDPALSIYEKGSPRFILKRERFSKNANLKDTDLVIGLMPCGATWDIIAAATKNNADFAIALCEGGPHGDIYDFYEDEEEWIHSMTYGARQEVKNNDMGELIVEHSLSDYNDPYPVIYNKRK